MKFFRKIADFYVASFRSSIASPTGRRLLILLALKISILLILFKILFFPNRLQTDYSSDQERTEAVRESLTK